MGQDMDNYPVVAMILRDLLHPEEVKLRPDPNSNKPPKPDNWSEAQGGIYYGEFQGGNKMMQGQFYALSRVVLECVFREFGQEVYRRPKFGHTCAGKTGEDSVTGCMIDQASMSSRGTPHNVHGGKCGDPWYVDVKLAQT